MSDTTINPLDRASRKIQVTGKHVQQPTLEMPTQQHENDDHLLDVDHILSNTTNTTKTTKSNNEQCSKSCCNLSLIFSGYVVAIVLFLTWFLVPVTQLPRPAKPDRCINATALPYPYPIPTALKWQECKDDSEIPAKETGLKVQCLNLKVPMSWDPKAPGCLYKETITIHAKRLFMANKDPSSLTLTQMWDIPGGAGNPSDTPSAVAGASQFVQGTAGALIYYFIDKRGTGRSSFYSCLPTSLFLTNLTQCLEQLKNEEMRDRLVTTTYTNTAKDFIHVMKTTNNGIKGGHQKRVVLGNSNGGKLTQVILAVLGRDGAPELIDAAILNSAPPANRYNISEGFMTADTIALDVVGECQADPTCAVHFTSALLPSAYSPLAARTDFYRRGLRGTHECLNELKTTFTEMSWGISSQLETPDNWQIIPVLFLRLARCNEKDKAALATFVSKIPSQIADPNIGSDTSLVVEYAINWSENFIGNGLDSTDTPERICDRIDGAESMSISYQTGGDRCKGWMDAMSIPGFVAKTLSPGLINDPFVNKVPDISKMTKVLYLIGEWDSAVPLPFVVALSKQYKIANPIGFQLVTVPHAGHTVGGNSPVSGGGFDCGFTMIISAATDPTGKFTPNTACIANVLGVDFAGVRTDGAKKTFLNVGPGGDMWND